jgi:competence ComEA-like helix-hairpin-helix protein
VWGREMRAGLVFVLVSLLAGAAFREWRRGHEHRFQDFIASLTDDPSADGDAPPGGSVASDSARAAGTPAGHPRRALPRPGRIDPDRADAAEWERLPGIGPALARRIVADRAARGPFGRPEALRRVPGIGPKTLERIRPFLEPGPAGIDSQAAN